MGMGYLHPKVSMVKEKLYPLPDIRKEIPGIMPPAIKRHYLILLHAMACEDTAEIASRQRRLLNGGYEVPISAKHCETLLEIH